MGKFNTQRTAGSGKWIQSAVRKEGAYTRYCKGLGYKHVTQACVSHGRVSGNPTVRRRAILVATLKKMPHRKKSPLIFFFGERIFFFFLVGSTLQMYFFRN